MDESPEPWVFFIPLLALAFLICGGIWLDYVTPLTHLKKFVARLTELPVWLPRAPAPMVSALLLSLGPQLKKQRRDQLGALSLRNRGRLCRITSLTHEFDILLVGGFS